VIEIGAFIAGIVLLVAVAWVARPDASGGQTRERGDGRGLSAILRCGGSAVID
jgi:hypothetical protein